MAVSKGFIAAATIGTTVAVGAPVIGYLAFSSKGESPENINENSEIEKPRVLGTLREKAKYANKPNAFGGVFASYFWNTEGNDEEWNKKLEVLKARGTEGHGYFANVNESVKNLKEVCKQRYEDESVVDKGNSSEVSEIWRFCGILEREPVVIVYSKNDLKDQDVEKGYIDEENEDAHKDDATKKYGKRLRKRVVSVDNKSNDAFWNIKQADFEAGRLDKTGATSTFFAKDQANKTIKSLCKDAYTKVEGSSGAPSKEEVIRYCSIWGDLEK